MSIVTATVNSLTYRSSGQNLTGNVLRVVFTVENQQHYHDLPNKGWSSTNKALQLMARLDVQPSDLDDSGKYVFEQSTVIPVTPNGEGYALANEALAGAQDDLERAEWFV